MDLRRQAGALLLVLAVTAAVASCGEGRSGEPSASTPAAAPSPSPSQSATQSPTETPSQSPTPSPSSPEPTPTPTATTAPSPTSTPNGVLRQGDRGAQVRALQERLVELDYWLGDVDGTFGANTRHAVVALQKAAGLTRDGIVGPRTLRALEEGVRPSPRSSTGRVVEIDLDRQLLLVVRDGHLQATFDTSTGAVAGTTPSGEWKITWQIDGLRQSPFGLLYRPKYFYGGVAIHGYTSVPPYPASHGCVRVTYPAMDHIWAAGLMPIGTPVLVY